MPARVRLLGYASTSAKAVLVLLIVAGWATSTVSACNVPVFRYALERWSPDPYHLAIFHDGDGEDGIRAALELLDKRPLRIHAEVVALDSVEEDDWRLENARIDREKLPWAVLRYPPRPGRSMPVVWAGAWTSDSLDWLAHSPIREEIVRRILLGESAVWVLVECGDAEKDRAARECLERELDEARRKLKIPGTEELNYLPTDSDTPGPEALALQEPTEAIPLKVEFSLLSLSRDNAAEQCLLAMLLGSEPDLEDYAAEPMAFPIFGQSRILWAIVGAGINAENIHESCAFLTGACSCQVKHMNPGTDLLVEFDWGGALEGRVPPPLEITAEMLTVVAPRLQEDEPEGELGTELGDGLSCPVVSAAGQAGADHQGPEDRGSGDGGPSADVSAVSAGVLADEVGASRGLSLYATTGAVLGGLLLAAVVATAILWRRKEP